MTDVNVAPIADSHSKPDARKGALLVGSSPLAMIPDVMNEIRGSRILDVGCGTGIYGFLLRHNWQDTVPGRVQFHDFENRDPRNDEPSLLVGVDVTLQNLRRCARHGSYDQLLLASADHLPFPDGYVDTVLCVEVLEHLEKADALRAIREFERVATSRVVITVPRDSVDEHTGQDERAFVNFASQDPDTRAWLRAERHRCQFTIKELRRLGFRCGREVELGLRAPLHKLKQLWQNYGWRSGQWLAVKELRRGVNASSQKPQSQLREAPRTVEGFADFRRVDLEGGDVG